MPCYLCLSAALTESREASLPSPSCRTTKGSSCSMCLSMCFYHLEVAAMCSGALVRADKQRRHQPTHPAARASPSPGPTAGRHPYPDLAAGRGFYYCSLSSSMGFCHWERLWNRSHLIMCLGWGDSGAERQKTTGRH